MYRNDDPSTVAAPPAVPSGAGLVPGFFTNGSAAAGQQGTLVPDWWLNQQQEEPLAVLGAAGIVPVKGQNNQLLAALNVLYGSGGALAASGWQRLPGGLILQWGSGNSGPNGFTQITYPIAFPKLAFPTIASEQNAAGWIGTQANGGTPSVHGVFARSLTGCSLYSQNWNAGSDLWVGGSGIAYGYFVLGN